MSFYSLEMEACAEPMQVLHTLAEYLPFKWEDFKLTSPTGYANKRLVGGRTVVCASTQDSRSQWFQEHFGFTPRLYVSMDVNVATPEVHCEAVRTVMQCTMVLLKNLQGNAVLTFYHEVLMLQRLKGELVLNAGAFSADYARQALPEITLSYELREMPLRL